MIAERRIAIPGLGTIDRASQAWSSNLGRGLAARVSLSSDQGSEVRNQISEGLGARDERELLLIADF
jgi:hypothetical protein